MHIKQFRYSADNFGYLVYGTKTALAVDPGAVDAMIEFAENKGVEITVVTNTHSHYDHTSGNSGILKKTQARFLDFQDLVKQKTIGGSFMYILLLFRNCYWQLKYICFAKAFLNQKEVI